MPKLNASALKRRIGRWFSPDHEPRDDERPERNPLTLLWPGLCAWARQWHEEGLINIEVIEPPDWGAHPKLEDKVLAMMEACNELIAEGAIGDAE